MKRNSFIIVIEKAVGQTTNNTTEAPTEAMKTTAIKSEPSNHDLDPPTNTSVEMEEDEKLANGSRSIRLVSSCYDDVLKEEPKSQPGGP